MKVTDLMIGDWVNYRPGWINEETGKVEWESNNEGYPVKIEFLYCCHGEGFVQYNDGENDGIEAADYELFPIPLTAEILEKNFPEPDEVTWFPQAGAFFCETTTNKDIMAHGIFRYVHQLQNCLKLVGIEKEIII